MAYKKTIRVLTPEFRVSFPSVFAPSAYEKQDPKYSLTSIFESGTDLSGLQAAVKEAAKDKWGADIPSNLKLPFHKGEKKDLKKYPEFKDTIFINMRSNVDRKPGIVDENAEPMADPSKFYGGCYAQAYVTVYAYDKMGNGVAFGLSTIQKTRDGEPFGAGPNDAEADFAPIRGSEEDPTAYGDSGNEDDLFKI